MWLLKIAEWLAWQWLLTFARKRLVRLRRQAPPPKLTLHDLATSSPLQLSRRRAQRWLQFSRPCRPTPSGSRSRSPTRTAAT